MRLFAKADAGSFRYGRYVVRYAGYHTSPHHTQIRELHVYDGGDLVGTSTLTVDVATETLYFHNHPVQPHGDQVLDGLIAHVSQSLIQPGDFIRLD